MLVLFAATKNAGQLLAVWRMIQKVAYSSARKGVTTQATLNVAEMLINCNCGMWRYENE